MEIKLFEKFSGVVKTPKGWKLIDKTFVKEWKFTDWNSATKFISKVMKSADKINHHPDLQIFGNKKVKAILTTHEKGNVTEKDVELAKIITQIKSDMDKVG